MKEGLEKDAKKLEPSDVKDVETNLDTGKKKGKEERPPTKVVVRRLPPTMTEEEFLQQIDPVPPVDYLYYVPADMSLSPYSFCRAYLNFINQSDIFIFTQKFDGYVFVDSKGMEYPAVVEFAPFQRIPKQRSGRKKDVKAGTIDSDPLYISFLEKLQAQIQENTTAGSNMKQHFFETNVGTNDEKVVTTPLLDFLRARYAERLRVREEKRKKDLERKRARDEQRRNAKKPDEESSVLKPPVVSMKPKTEDERLMEQQTIFLRKLLGLPNPVNQRSCKEVVEGLADKLVVNYCSDSVLDLVNGTDKITSLSSDFKLSIDEPFYSNYSSKYSNSSTGKSKYLYNNRNSGIKLCCANGYWKRDISGNDSCKNRKLWNQSESKYDNFAKSKMNLVVSPIYGERRKDIGIPNYSKQAHALKYQEGSSEQSYKVKENDYTLEKELLDESALEAFPTFEESKLHKLQKNILKSPLIHTSPINKESVEEIKMKFQLWTHDVTTKSCSVKKRDAKKADLTQVRIMKPPSRFIRNGINRMMRENDESRLELIYESILKDDIKIDSSCSKANDSMSAGSENLKYFSQDYDNFIKSHPVNEITSQEKNNYSNCNSRFLIPNNLKLPKAFGSGRKTVSHISLPLNHAKSSPIPNDGLPKAFNSLLKCDKQKHSCHQSHRNETMIRSSEGSSNPDNINRKSSPCSIIC